MLSFQKVSPSYEGNKYNTSHTSPAYKASTIISGDKKSSELFCNSLKGHKLSLLMFSGKVKTIELPQTIGPEERKTIQNVLDNCHYTKLPSIKNPEQIQLQASPKSITVLNFDTPDTETINGNCGELTPKVITILEQKLDGKVLLAYGTGVCQKYNMRHAFIIAFKDTPENRQKYERITNNYKKLTDEIMPHLEDLRNPEKCANPKFIETIQRIMEKAQNLIHQPTDLKNALLIDPSFGTIIDPDAEGNFEGYGIQAINKLSNAIKLDEWGFEELSDHTEKIPIGYVKELAPELSDAYPPQALLFMALNKGETQEEKDVFIYVAKDETDFFPSRISDIEAKLSNDNPLKKFIQVMRTKLQAL